MTFENFYLAVYLPAHRRPATRYLHFAGTAVTVCCAILAMASLNPWWSIGLVAGYGFAWPAHWWIEHNQPETLVDFPRHVAQSLLADLAMLTDWLDRDLSSRLDRSRLLYPDAWSKQ